MISSKQALENNNYRELDVKCCDSCKHSAQDYDGNFNCTLLTRWNFENIEDDTCYILPLGLCDLYEGI